jgi:trimeric autotransporter adhesin
MRKHTLQVAAIAVLLFELIAQPAWPQNTVQTIAGEGPNNLPATKASIGSPTSITSDSSGNLYMTEVYSNRVFRVSSTGTVGLVAGNGARGGFSGGDGGPATSGNLTYPTGVAVDSSGNIFIADQTYCRIRKVSAQTGDISTVAGTGVCSSSGDGGSATTATLNNPSGVAVDSLGNIIIADTNNCSVRRVSASTGVITTLAGKGSGSSGALLCGYSGDGGLATSAALGFANDVALDSSGNIFIADTTNCAIRKITVSTGVISTVAGSVSCGYSGDGASATAAQLDHPRGVALDISGNVYIADTTNCVVRKISASDLKISSVAGSNSIGCGYSGDGGAASNAQLDQPYGVTVGSSGDIFIADFNNSVIREVSASSGNISTYAGVTVPDPNHPGHLIGLPAFSGDGYPALDAELGFLNDSPYGPGMATDSSGNIYFADTANNAVRKISAATGIITTLAGDGLIGNSGDGGPAIAAELFYPRDVAVDGSGNIFIMDSGNCVVRKITSTTGIISTVAGTAPDSAGYHCDYSGDGGPATSAQLYTIDLLIPAGGVAVDDVGNLYIADTGNGVIRKVSAATGIISTVAGQANSILATGDGGPAVSSTLFAPYGVAVDNSGNIYIADTDDYAVREVTAINGNIYTVAGNMGLGPGFSGDGGPAGSARLRNVFNIFLDPAGNLFIPDTVNCVVRKVSGSTGVISTVVGMPNQNGDTYCGYAGDGGPALSANFDFPSATGAGPSGSLVVLDDIRVREVAGMVPGPAAAAVPVPNPLEFPNQSLGAPNTLTVVLSDRGALPTSVSKVSISGVNGSDFSEMDNCVGKSLAGGGGSCAINVKFTPSIAGAESALLTINDAAGTQTVSLAGAGVVAPVFSASTSTIPFGNQQSTVASPAKSLTITNNGGADLSIASVVTSGPNMRDFMLSANSCSGAVVATHSTCSVSVIFTPSTAGAEVASLQFIDNATGSPQMVSLTGAGMDFSIGLAAGSSATATVQAGTPATFNLQVAAIGDFTGTVSLSCSGAPRESTCMLSEASATPNGNTAGAFSVQVITAAASIASRRGYPPWRPFNGFALSAVVFLVAFVLMLLAPGSRARGAALIWRRAYLISISFGCLVLGTAFLVGCGGSTSTTTQQDLGTPMGTYVLTITGTASGVSHSQTLTLTVN